MAKSLLLDSNRQTQIIYLVLIRPVGSGEPWDFLTNRDFTTPQISSGIWHAEKFEDETDANQIAHLVAECHRDVQVAIMTLTAERQLVWPE